MRIVVLGGDGFCGWPTALHLSARGHEISIVDNLSRRNIDNELEASSLTPIRPIGERLRIWKKLSGRDIEFHNEEVMGSTPAAPPLNGLKMHHVIRTALNLVGLSSA